MNSLSFWVANGIAAVFVLLVAAGAAVPALRGRVLSQDYLAGLMFQGFGIFTLWMGLSLPLGTAIRMGPGYVPRMLAFIMLGMGAVIAAQALFTVSVPPQRGQWRPFIMIMLSVVAFAIAFDLAGLIPAIVACIIVASAGDPTTKWGQTVVSLLILIVICVGVFVAALGLPMDVAFGLSWSQIIAMFR